MLTLSGLKKFYFLPNFHDMRCKAPKVAEIVRNKYHRDPLNGDVYIFMSRNCRRVRMIHYALWSEATYSKNDLIIFLLNIPQWTLLQWGSLKIGRMSHCGKAIDYSGDIIQSDIWKEVDSFEGKTRSDDELIAKRVK